jgi:hypothetical protein
MATIQLVITIANSAFAIGKVEEQVGPAIDAGVDNPRPYFQSNDQSGATTGEFGIALPVAKGNFLHPKVLPFGRSAGPSV